MSQNVTHTKKIARALVARTGMSYTHARKMVKAGAEAGLLEPPYSDDRLPVLADALLGSPLVAARLTVEGAAVAAGATSASKQAVGNESVADSTDSSESASVERALDWSRVVRVKFEETNDRWWTVRAMHGHFVVLTQQVPFQPKGTLRYTVVDQEREVRGPCNLVGQGWSGIETERGCKVLVRAMALGVVEVSHRNNVQIRPTVVDWAAAESAAPAAPADEPVGAADGVVGEPDVPKRVRTGPEALASAIEMGRDLANAGGGQLVYEVTTHDVAGLLRRTAVLIASGMPIATCIDLAARSAKTTVLRTAMADIAVLMKEGWRAHEAFGAYPVLFDDFIVATVFAGEQSGAIEKLLTSAAEAITAEKPRPLIAHRFTQGVLPRGERKALVLNA